MSKQQQAALKDTISVGGQEKRKDRKTRKSRGKEKRVGFSSPSLLHVRKTGGSHPGLNHLTREIDHMTRRRTQGAGIVKR